MNNPNPFVPRGSLLENQSQRRSRLKLAVFCVLAISVTGLTAMLIQGCKRETPNTDLNPPPLLETATNNFPLDGTNPPMTDFSNPPVMVPPVVSNLPVVIPPVVGGEVVAPVSGSEYVVVKGDSLAKIAKKYGVPVKALQDANPGVVPTKLKIGQKLVIPAGGKAAAEVAVPAVAGVSDSGTTTYTVKSGDTLTKIAKAHGTTVKKIEAANGLTTTKISVGQKLKIPGKAEAAPVAPVPAPMVEPAPASLVPPPVYAPAPTTAAPAPGR